jgi:hypothetical protein
MELKPTMGRVVKYLHPGSADGKYPPTESPAIVQAVYTTAVSDNPEDGNQDVVDLFVMSNTGGIFFAKKCVLGKNWDWLDYTKSISN